MIPLTLQLNTDDDIAVIKQKRSLTLSSTTAPFGSPVKVSWNVPIDEATKKDWIGELEEGTWFDLP